MDINQIITNYCSLWNICLIKALLIQLNQLYNEIHRSDVIINYQKNISNNILQLQVTIQG